MEKRYKKFYLIIRTPEDMHIFATNVHIDTGKDPAYIRLTENQYYDLKSKGVSCSDRETYWEDD